MYVSGLSKLLLENGWEEAKLDVVNLAMVCACTLHTELELNSVTLRL